MNTQPTGLTNTKVGHVLFTKYIFTYIIKLNNLFGWLFHSSESYFKPLECSMSHTQLIVTSIWPPYHHHHHHHHHHHRSTVEFCVPIDTQCLEHWPMLWEQSILTLDSLCRLCYMRDSLKKKYYHFCHWSPVVEVEQSLLAFRLNLKIIIIVNKYLFYVYELKYNIIYICYFFIYIKLTILYTN